MGAKDCQRDAAPFQHPRSDSAVLIHRLLSAEQPSIPLFFPFPCRPPYLQAERVFRWR